MNGSQRFLGLVLLLSAASGGWSLAQPAPDYGSMVQEGAQARGRGDFERSIKILSEARSLQPQDARASLELAVSYEWAGRLPDAEATYRKLLAVQPTLEGGWLGLARVLRWQWRFTEALACYHRVLESPTLSGPMRREAALGIAQIDRLEMRLEDARVRLQALQQQAPADPEILDELGKLDNTTRHRLQLTLGEREGPAGRSTTWLAGWSTQVDARTFWKAGVASNTAGQPTLATDVPVNDIRTLWFAEGRQFVPMGQSLWGRAEWRQMYLGASQYQLQGEWSDQLVPRWRGSAGLAFAGPQAATRRTVSAGLSNLFLPGWDAGVTAYTASGGPAPAQQTLLTRLGWERDGVLAQLFVSRSSGQTPLSATALLRMPLPQGYQLRFQVSRDGIAQVNAWSVGLVVPFGKDVGVQVQHDVRNDERAWSVGADIAIRNPLFNR